MFPRTPTVIRMCLMAGMLALIMTESTVKAQPGSVLESLSYEPAENLARSANRSGDAARGAQVFHLPLLACSRCHATADSGPMSLPSVGPNLTRDNPSLTDVGIVEAILHPSRSIAVGFETVQVLTADGRVYTGTLVERTPEAVRIRDPANGEVIAIDPDQIDDLRTSPQSIMPEGVAGQLTSRQQFLDLVRFLIEIRDFGPERAAALRPAVLPQSEPLPDYERRLDHAGMIGSLDDESFRRGKAIYHRSCVNCHGTLDQPGSLPTSLRFGEGKFKNGSDPYSMYRTVTDGFGLMTPQPWMVPEQKYDVIHFIRQSFLKRHNPSQYVRIDDAYLAGLPAGNTRGPKPSLVQPWQQMDYGPNLMATYEVGDDGTNFAYKGHAIRLDHGPGGVAGGRYRMLYEHDTMRVAAAWTGDEFIDWNGINFNGLHNRHPRIVGDVLFANANGPGWANPTTGSFDEVRSPGRDGRYYGPLPDSWIDYRGSYACGPETILHYCVGTTEIHELPAATTIGRRVVFERRLTIGPAEVPLTVRIADRPQSNHPSLRAGPNERFILSQHREDPRGVAFGVVGDASGTEWQFVDDEVRLRLPPAAEPRRITLCAFAADDEADAEATIRGLDRSAPGVDLAERLQGGVRRWPELAVTDVTRSDSDDPLVVETLQSPSKNPWFCRMRLTGVDFVDDGESAVVCDWDGNVWRVTGLHEPRLTWQRIASGLFQPLGIKIRDGQIFVTCRDQICRLHDLDGDAETDYYESFNHDHLVTEHFHEFAMGLQCDADGNFYYAKSARHALPALVPHHGTLLRVSADGATTEILATGFRAANGVCLNDDGTFFVTDQEGHWNPKNRINWVKPGRFYGNMLGYHDITDSSDSAMEPPMCWITNEFDRSPAELLRLEGDQWGPLRGSLVNLSYGYGKLYVVPHERKEDRMQGGMSELPLPAFPTGIMRGRCHPSDGALYLVGMFAWAGNRQEDGGFFRVRRSGEPLFVPRSLECRGTTIRIGLSDAVDPGSVSADHFALRRWNLKRTKNYGSEHYDTQEVEVESARWIAESREIVLEIPDLRPTWCMEIRCDLRTPAGQPIVRVIHNTIHDLGNASGKP